MIRLYVFVVAVSLTGVVAISAADDNEVDTIQVVEIMEQLRAFSFHPIVDGMTKEPMLNNTDGVANTEDQAWRVRLLAIRDITRLGPDVAPHLLNYLKDDNEHVRQVSAFVLGLFPDPRGEQALIDLLQQESDVVVRSQAALSLGRLRSNASLAILKDLEKNDPSRDVRHQCSLAIHRITEYAAAEPDLAAAFAQLDESHFEQVRIGAQAPEFILNDVDGKEWRLSDFLGKQSVALIWIFADWCPVCHNEFRELIRLKEAYKEAGVQVFSIECSDPYRARVMAGLEYQPEYWFSKKSPQEFYGDKLWWPHLIDLGCAVGATYGVQPMQFTVHAEWINRPATILIDKEGIVRFAYYGTFWGDRPSLRQALNMLVEGNYEFEHPKRLKLE